MADDKEASDALKKARTSAKVQVTRKKNELNKMIESEESPEVIENKAKELTDALQNFESSHERYLPYTQNDPPDYYMAVRDEVTRCLQLAGLQSDTCQASAINQAAPSIVRSRASSKASSIMSVRAKAAAKKAVLQAQMEMFKKKQELDKEEFELRQRREQFDLATNIAMADAEIKACIQIETELNELNDEDISDDDDRGQSIKSVPVALPQQPTNSVAMATHNFNPTAPVWAGTNVSNTSLLNAIGTAQVQQQHLMQVLQMPKVEIEHFDGNPLKYWTFIRFFESSVDNTGMSDHVKLVQLMTLCAGKARKAIEGCAAMEPSTGYQRAKCILKERFGNDYAITEQWVRDITSKAVIKSNDSAALREFADELTTCRDVLRGMQRMTEMNCQTNLVKVIHRLPPYLQGRWRKEVRETKVRRERLPVFEDLVNFVIGAAEEANDPIYGNIFSEDVKATGKSSRRKANYSIDAAQHPGQNGIGDENVAVEGKSKVERLKCKLCEHEHPLYRCINFKKMSPGERFKFSRSKGLCDLCLYPGHRAHRCKSEYVCTVQGCGKKHCKLLHVNSESTEPQSETTCNSTGAGVSRVALPIVPVKVTTLGGRKTINTYALLDSGSTTSFCKSELTEKLGIKGKRETLSLSTLTNQKENLSTEVVQIKVENVDGKGERIHIPRVYVCDKMSLSSSNLATQEDIARYPHLNGINLPQVGEREVLLLLGMDVPEVMAPLEVRRGQKGALYAVKTALGWTIHGPLEGTPGPRVASTNYAALDRLETQVQRFWELESMETRKHVNDVEESWSVEDRKAMTILTNSTQRVNGHYQMAIPFRKESPKLPVNASAARDRLESLKRRLMKDEVLKKQYSDEMAKLVENNHVEKVPETELSRDDGKVFYLPHHPVFHPRKPGKVRIVFDAASEYKNISLNKTVLQGPDLMNNLAGVLLRFRQEKVTIMADVEQMFLQVLVDPDHKDALRFLWYENGDFSRDPVVYRSRVHLFGVISSPSCANYALKRTANDQRENYSVEAVNTVLNDFYVDDLLKSVSNVDEAVSMVTELREMLAQGGFKLTKWLSNERQVLKSIPEEDLAKPVKEIDLNYDDLPTDTALGMHWNAEKDTFRYQTVDKNKPLTKRGVLSTVSAMYDPLGYLCPFILPAKLILQELCRKKVGWDEPLPDLESLQWSKWVNDLTKLEGFEVNRCLNPHEFGEVARRELHHFCDASMRGYGVCSYLRLVSMDGRVSCNLVMAKSRVAPIKTQTIPRLELNAAALAVKVDKFLKKELSLPIEKTFFWTDSTITLHYISNEEKRYSVFVANRVAVIRDNSDVESWFHVDSAQNPADDCSRGLSACQLIESKRWLMGPEYLYQSGDKWPEQSWANNNGLENDPEIMKPARVYQTSAWQSIMDRFVSRYSSWLGLKKSVAWLLRLKTKLRNKVRSKQGLQLLPVEQDALSVFELQKAETEIIKFVQGSSFSVEIKLLEKKSNSKLPKTSSVRRLDPILIDGVLCVGGRMRNAASSDICKHQILLPKSHHVVDLIIRQCHEALGHVGVEHVLSLLRDSYWIVQGRHSIKKILRSCFSCKKRVAKPCTPKMADLPTERITPNLAPFSFTGIDFFGPFEVKQGRTKVKRYGCMFTCLASRAVHIEIAHSLDTDTFINAFIRFMSRRNKPVMVWSDNGRNFVGAQKVLKSSIESWNSQRIEAFFQQKEIAWKFNPPLSSHMGGVWERMIRTTRKILGALIGQQTLNDESLQTLICQVESIINTRPLTKVSDDPNDQEAITPNHILLLKGNNMPPPGVFVNDDLYCRKRWRQVQYLANLFWKRWVKEYLTNLQIRQKWLTTCENLKVGDLVLIVDELSHRSQWPLGLVEQTFPGKDGQVRSVKVKFRNTSLLRPAHKICRLEVSLSK